MLPTNPLLNATAPAGPHLPVALLRQYAAGTLAPAAQHRVEAHTLACPRCADILDGLLQTPATTTDQALAQLQQRLRKRVQQAPQARPALGGRRQHRWLAPQLAAAATLLFGLVAGGWWTWQQRHPAAGPAALPAAQVATVPAPASPRPAKPAPAPAAAPAASADYSTVRPAPPQRPASRAQHSSALARHTPALAPDTLAVAAVLPPAAEPPVTVAAPVASAPPAVPDTLAMTPAKQARSVAAAAPAPTADAARLRAAMPAAPPLPATPIGGYPALREKLRREATKFVPEAPEHSLSGTVQLRVIIGADGKIQQINVVRGLREDYDEEAQRLVCDGPAWVPGVSAGRRAAQVVDIAVPFN